MLQSLNKERNILKMIKKIILYLSRTKVMNSSGTMIFTLQLMHTVRHTKPTMNLFNACQIEVFAISIYLIIKNA